MITRILGRSGLEVSEICLGTMMFGGPTPDDEARRIVDHAIDHGVNFLDTADTYNDGASEEVVGRCIRSTRHRWIVATKVGNAYKTADKRATGGLTRRWVMEAVDLSLGRMGLDHIDIYYVHRTNPHVVWDELVATFGDLVRSGKIRYWGLSNVRAWQLAEIANQCDRQLVPRPVVLQPYYNAMNRQPEVELLPAARHYGLGVVPYSPIARGVLTGKYQPGARPAEGTRAARQDKRILETEWREESLEIAQEVVKHAARRGASPIDFAVNWVLNNAAISSVIAGPRTFEQWTQYFGYASYTWTAEDEALIDGFVRTGHPSTPGFNDPSYPIEGRFPRVR
jgi:aryl-alcohol dehydrogenase-like predicted oxidoreductase